MDSVSEKDMEDSQAVSEVITNSNRPSRNQYELASSKFSEKISVMQQSYQEEPDDPDEEDDIHTGSHVPADEGYSEY